MVGGRGRRALIGPFLLIDLTFLSANMLKVFEGGWMPLALGAVVMLVMYTWRRGTQIPVRQDAQAANCRWPNWSSGWRRKPPPACPGTAIFLTADPAKRADRAAAQPQALQGAARAQRHPDHRIRSQCRASIRQSGCGSSRFPRRSPASAALRFHGDARTCRRRLRSRANSAGNSTSCRRRSSCRAARCGRRNLGHAALAGSSVHRAGAHRKRCHRLFPGSDRAGGRGREHKSRFDRQCWAARSMLI